MIDACVNIHPQSGSFFIPKTKWNEIFEQEHVNPCWVHIMAAGILELNRCCSFAFRKHWKKKQLSHKRSPVIFRATARCTFSSCTVIAKIEVTNKDILTDSVKVAIQFSGEIQHIVGETHARRLSHSIRRELQEKFQKSQHAPSKEYLHRLMSLHPDQYWGGNRDGVGCTRSVVRKVSSEARLLQEPDRDLLTSLLLIQKTMLASETTNSNTELTRCNSPVKGFIQFIHASPFGVICFNEAGVRLYHEVAKYCPVFCDATGSIVAIPSDCGIKSTVYYYCLVVKHPVSGKPPLAVAEYISCDHTVLAVSFFLHSFRRAEGLLFGSSNLTQPVRLIIDRSMVLLISFLQVYNLETIQDYLLRAFRIVTGAANSKDIDKVLPHACTSHVMNSAKKNCKKW